MSGNDMPRTAECVEPEALDALLALAEGDPRRDHLRTCARCHALAESYALFLAPADAHESHVDDADRAFDALRARLLAGEVSPALRRSTWRDWFAPALRPAWALAALTVLVGGALVVSRLQAPAPNHVLRGTTDQAMTLAPPVALADGDVRLGWKGVPGADTYEVVFYSSTLDELDRAAAGAETSILLPAGRIPAVYEKGEILLYRIIASHGGDEVARSPVGTLRRK